MPNTGYSENKGEGLSVAALICGILGIIGSWIPLVCYFTFVLAILGIVFGVKGRKYKKNGLATAGLVLGIIGTCLGAIGILCVAWAFGVLNYVGTTSMTM